MNYFSPFDPELQWPLVTANEFDRIMSTLNYRREAWSDVLVYLTVREPSVVIGYELHATDTYHVHPELE